MDDLELHPVTLDNWQAALGLTVRPDQLHFVADYQPIAAIALAKAYIRPGGKTWVPYAIATGPTMIGFLALAYTPASVDDYWVFHFFIDQHAQGRGYGTAAVQRLIELVRREHPQCRTLHLTVHPENRPAQRLYTRAGFRPTGAERWGELVYQLILRANQ
jgi:diamine N-acetyltransferase